MLELKDITKVYKTGGETVEALKGISLKFRNNEFVSILGQSGCGKTTMLNIIGGLDKYTSGDLVINGRSTTQYKDRDWDAYRNHSIGFVFQSYNLIPHQTVLQNVELALTLSGVRKSERRKRAIEALEKVGLKDQIKKKPAEMSGGQMQRVAIARAIVNNPDIILADEPTGALDTETSVQVMEILKEISADRLVIMVTHNPELAEKYSTRIVRMLDGRITADSMPLTEEEVGKAEAEDKVSQSHKKQKKPSMSFGTSFGLSLKNLFTKKKRTALISFAGSIGIIGIALIYAVSNGTTNYINIVQEQTLSSYPISLEAQSIDLSSLITSFMGTASSEQSHDNDAVYQKDMLYSMVNSMGSMETSENDLTSFKEYLEQQMADESTGLADAITSVQYKYDLDLQIYTENVDGDIISTDTQQLVMDLMTQNTGVDFSSLMTLTESSTLGNSYMSTLESGSSLWTELLPGDKGNLISDASKDQYDLLYGSWPNSYDEVVVFVDENNEISDLCLYAMGLKSEEEMQSLMNAAIDETTIESEAHKWTYEDICGLEFKTILNSSCYSYDEESGTYKDLRETETGLRYLYDNGLTLRVVGIVRPSQDAVSSTSSSAIGYTHALTEYVINESQEADIVKAQKDNPDVDVLTGLKFASNEDTLTTQDKAQAVREYLDSLSGTEKLNAFAKILATPSDDTVNQMIESATSGMTRDDIMNTILAGMESQLGMDESQVKAYIDSMSDEELESAYKEMIKSQITSEYAQSASSSLEGMDETQQIAMMEQMLSAYTDEDYAGLYDELFEFSDSTYDDNLAKFGCIDLNSPSGINIYVSTFADKDTIETLIDTYNAGVDDMHQITYTDYVGLIMSSVTTIINAITYVLIAFVAVSLIVSSIMIGVITLISVQERTKEIGILRAIGASKRNVSSMFNAETLIIGFTSGLVGIGITYLLCILINAVLHALTGIESLSANLPVSTAAILVAISMLLTLIAGIIPSSSAAKKDPVVALRTE